MNAGWLQRVQEVFTEALKRSSAERAAYLAEACGADTELRAEVESLLKHDRQAGSDFLRSPGRPPRMATGTCAVPANAGATGALAKTITLTHPTRQDPTTVAEFVTRENSVRCNC
jgi:hypothetical protein